EFRTRPAEARLDRASAHSLDAPDFLQRQALDLRQDKRGPLLEWQRLQRPIQPVKPLLALGLQVGRLHVRLLRKFAGEVGTPALEGIAASVAGDREQPGAEGGPRWVE